MSTFCTLDADSIITYRMVITQPFTREGKELEINPEGIILKVNGRYLHGVDGQILESITISFHGEKWREAHCEEGARRSFMKIYFNTIWKTKRFIKWITITMSTVDIVTAQATMTPLGRSPQQVKSTST